jgi:mRNA interferase RelE/StbE
MYKLRLEKRATKALQKIAEPMKSRIIKALDEMTRDPFSGDIRALQGEWKGFYRRRVGDFRIVYSVDSDIKIVSIESITDRKDSY